MVSSLKGYIQRKTLRFVESICKKYEGSVNEFREVEEIHIGRAWLEKLCLSPKQREEEIWNEII